VLKNQQIQPLLNSAKSSRAEFHPAGLLTNIAQSVNNNQLELSKHIHSHNNALSLSTSYIYDR
jgi:hypothetical protein